jgi:hypothetical protein
LEKGGGYLLSRRTIGSSGQRPVFCKRGFSFKPPSSMTQRSRLKPLLQKDKKMVSVGGAFAPNLRLR